MNKQDEACERWLDSVGIPMPTAYEAITRNAFAAGREAEREHILEIAITLPRLQVEGQWHIDLDEITRRIKEQE